MSGSMGTVHSWRFLKDRLETNTWVFYHKAFIALIDDVIDAPLIDSNSA